MGSIRVEDESKEMSPEELEDLFETTPLTEDTTCGYWFLRGNFLQKFASKKVYVLTYGLSGSLIGATYAYFNGTISTIEKLFRIPSRNSGIISVGNDVGSLLLSSLLGYYCGSGHRPRWIAFGMLTIALFCFMNAMPHFLYGIGQDALEVTLEHGRMDANKTSTVIEAARRKALCRLEESGDYDCPPENGNMAPQIILFTAQLISGIGQNLHYSLGTTYMDDNVQKNKAPSLISISYFMRLCGPALGYFLVSKMLDIYIDPSLTPTITTADPRWLGAWWIGWLALGVPVLLSAVVFALFPKTLPRAAVRKSILKDRQLRGIDPLEPDEHKTSFKDMMKTFKRLLGNPIYMFSTWSGVFYAFGYSPYWMFTPKYMEIQYRLTAAKSSMMLGTYILGFSAAGILAAGFVITRFKPSARTMATWNVLVAIVTVCGMTTYAFLGCTANERSADLLSSNMETGNCNTNCHCDYVKYSPVCGVDGKTYSSACHAGCTESQWEGNNPKIFTNCSCIRITSPTSTSILDNSTITYFTQPENVAHPGPCPVDCTDSYFKFIAVMCVLKFIGSSSRAANFLLAVRCVDEKDKTASLGFTQMFMSLITFVPAPIFYGYLFDSTCLVWGKTCSGTGNCWLYDSASLRWTLNTITASCMAVCVLFDVGVWWFSKDVKMFDDVEPDSEETEMSPMAESKEHEATGKRMSLNDSKTSVMLSKRMEHRGSVDL